MIPEEAYDQDYGELEVDLTQEEINHLVKMTEDLIQQLAGTIEASMKQIQVIDLVEAPDHEALDQVANLRW